MKILFNTNVVLDVLLNRQPFAANAIHLFSAVEQAVIQGFLCATTITTLDYLCTKTIDRQSAKNAINGLLELFAVAEVNQHILKAAIASGFTDFEDAVLYQAGICAGIDGLVTRNAKDFNLAECPVYHPNELCNVIQK